MGARLWGAIVVAGRAEAAGGRAELTVGGAPLVVKVDGGDVTVGADVAGTEVGAENWDGVGTRASLSPPVEVAMYSDPSITVSARSEMLRAEAR